MKALTASLILSVMFLSAGAFAGNTHRAAAPELPMTENITVILKNQAWPVAGRISVETCKISRCVEI
jgi:hypothetical protein